MEAITKIREMIGKILDQTITKGMSDDDIQNIYNLASMLSGMQAVNSFVALPMLKGIFRNTRSITKYATIVVFLCQCVLDYRNKPMQY